VFSFGHAAFMVIGAYVTTVLAFPVQQRKLLLPALPGLVQHISLSPVLACVAGGAIAAVVAAMVAVPLARLSGIAAALASFAILGIVHVVASNWQQFTNGVSGIAGLPATTTPGVALGWALFAVQTSAWGRRLQASREDEVAARSVGIAVRPERRQAFVLSAFVVGVAGGLYAELLGNLTPDTIYLDVTFLIVVMLVVGGIKSLSGAVVGSIFISAVSEILRRLEEGAHVGPLYIQGRTGMREVGLAIILLLALIARPAGLTAGRELTWPERLSWRSRARAELKLESPEPAPNENTLERLAQEEPLHDRA
jgi:branched-chain amino acid transport system permease protein